MIFAVHMAQQPVQYVKYDDRARVAQMGAIIDRRPADIHPHILVIDGRENLALAGFSVVQLDRGHVTRPYARMARAWHRNLGKKTL